MRKFLAVFLSGVALAIAASTALAGEQVLEFKLVTKPIDYKITEAANIEGQTVASGRLFGVAVFKDGRIGVKEFVNSSDLLKGTGPFYGYSTYTFEDGSITARYTGSVKDGRSNGEYTILSGTGAYANATGTGTIESAPNPFKGGITFEGEKGTLHVDRKTLVADPPEILKEEVGSSGVKLYVSHNHHGNFLDCVKSRKLPVADVATAAAS